MATDTIEIPPPAAETAEQVQATAAIEKRSPAFEEGGIKLATLTDAMTFGKMAIDSGLAPRAYTRPSQVVMAVQMGNELGLGPATSLRALYPAPGNQIELYAKTAMALCQRSGHLVDWKDPEYSGEGESRQCTFSVRRKGIERWLSITFSVREAKQAGLFRKGGGWEMYPDRMLLARSKAWCLKDNFSDVLLGVSIEGEIDPAEARDMPPPEPPAPKAPPPGGFGLLQKVQDTKPRADVVEAEIVATAPGPVLTVDPEVVEALAGTPIPEVQTFTSTGNPATVDVTPPARETKAEIVARLRTLVAPIEAKSKKMPPGPFAKAVEALESEPQGCGHDEAKKQLKVRPVGAKWTCEDCGVEVKTIGGGMFRTVEPPE